MPPKGAKKAPSHVGSVQCRDQGFRVAARIDGRYEYGPYRTTREEADTDLAQAQSTQSQEQYRNILAHLREVANSVVAPPGANLESSGSRRPKILLSTLRLKNLRLKSWRLLV